MMSYCFGAEGRRGKALTERPPSRHHHYAAGGGCDADGARALLWTRRAQEDSGGVRAYLDAARDEDLWHDDLRADGAGRMAAARARHARGDGKHGSVLEARL